MFNYPCIMDMDTPLVPPLLSLTSPSLAQPGTQDRDGRVFASPLLRCLEFRLSEFHVNWGFRAR